MIDAVIGSIIMMTASMALLLAVEVAEKMIKNAGTQPLSYSEKVWIESLQFNQNLDPDKLEAFKAELEALEGG